LRFFYDDSFFFQVLEDIKPNYLLDLRNLIIR
jgi:hypothetical protein